MRIAPDASDRHALVTVSTVESAETRLELYDLRTLKYVRRLGSHEQILGVTFDPVRGTFICAVRNGERYGLHEIALEQGELVPLGHITGADILNAARTVGGLALETHDDRSARMFLVHPDGTEELIGIGVHQADVSVAGDVLYHQSLSTIDSDHGQLHVWRRGSPAARRLLAEGNGFRHPVISSDGSSAVYFRRPGGEIFHCDLRREGNDICELVHVDPGLQDRFRPSPIGPDGDKVPYLAFHAHRWTDETYLRVLSLSSRQVRDLGRIDTGCDVFWASERTLWVWPRQALQMLELDIESGRSTPRPWLGEAPAPCPKWPDSPLKTPYRIRREHGFSIRLVDDRPRRAAPLMGPPPGARGDIPLELRALRLGKPRGS